MPNLKRGGFGEKDAKGKNKNWEMVQLSKAESVNDHTKKKIIKHALRGRLNICIKKSTKAGARFPEPSADRFC
jgi:hypothetical protein